MSHSEYYFQKSLKFLYPVLGLNRPSIPKPLNTFLKIEGFEFEHSKPLIALYSTSDLEHGNSLALITENHFYEYHEDLLDGTSIIVFDLNEIHEEYDRIISGKYSELSSAMKTIIRNSFPNDDVRMALEPKKYAHEICERLGVSIEAVMESGELCSPPKMTTEGEVLHVKSLKELANKYHHISDF